ncbi:MAG: FtsW/RodA/SpoVE family cell cycle protein, partial [Ramlibacter sp.]
MSATSLRNGRWFSSWFGPRPGPVTALPVRGAGTARAAAPVRAQGFDQTLLWVTVALLAFGLVMVYSASIAMPDNPKFSRYAHTYFLTRHTISLVVAFIAALLAFQVPVTAWEKMAPWLFVLSLMLLIAVLIPHVGSVVNGARRWISLGFMG